MHVVAILIIMTCNYHDNMSLLWQSYSSHYYTKTFGGRIPNSLVVFIRLPVVAMGVIVTDTCFVIANVVHDSRKTKRHLSVYIKCNH